MFGPSPHRVYRKGADGFVLGGTTAGGGRRDRGVLRRPVLNVPLSGPRSTVPLGPLSPPRLGLYGPSPEWEDPALKCVTV